VAEDDDRNVREGTQELRNSARYDGVPVRKTVCATVQEANEVEEVWPMRSALFKTLASEFWTRCKRPRHLDGDSEP